MKTILTYGTFDLFHIGHLNFLKKAKSLGDRLIVGISTDEFNNMKGKHSTIPYSDRKAIVEAIKYVDETFPEISWDQKIDDITKYNADVFVIGEDWKGKFDYLKSYCQVIYLARTPNISTSLLKNLL